MARTETRNQGGRKRRRTVLVVFGILAMPIVAQGEPPDVGGNRTVASRIAVLQVTGQVIALAFSPDNHNLAIARTPVPNVQIFSLGRTKQMVMEFSVGEDLNIEAHPAAITYSADGNLVALKHDYSNVNAAHAWEQIGTKIHVWRLPTRALLNVIDDGLGGAGLHPVLEFDGSGELVRLRGRASRSEGDQFLVQRPDASTVLWGLQLLPFRPRTFAIGPDGTRALLGGIDPSLGPPGRPSVIVVDMTKRLALPARIPFAAGYEPSAIGWNADGTRFVVGATSLSSPVERNLKVFDATSGKELAAASTADQFPATVRYMHNDQYIVECGSLGAVKMWDSSLRQMVQSIEGLHGPVGISRNGRLFAGVRDSTVEIWQVN